MIKRVKYTEESFIGMVYNELTVLEVVETIYFKSGHRSFKLKCLCSCGDVKIIFHSNVISGHTKSCGHISRERAKLENATHGLSKHKLFGVHQTMQARCYKEYSDSYERYGGQGIYICDEWLIKENNQGFINFYNWSLEKGYKEGLTIDRYPDQKGPYAPWNCRWATFKEQSNNQISNLIFTAFGETDTLCNLVDKYGKASSSTVRTRIKAGWDIEEALTTLPCQIKHKNGTQIDISHSHEYRGEVLSLQQIIKISNTTIPLYIVSDRLRKGWDIERALTQPVRKRP